MGAKRPRQRMDPTGLELVESGSRAAAGRHGDAFQRAGAGATGCRRSKARQRTDPAPLQVSGGELRDRGAVVGVRVGSMVG